MAREFACQPAAYDTGAGALHPKTNKQTNARELNRLQICYVGPYPIVNVLCVPTRRHFFRDQFFRVMRGLGTKLPIIDVDFSCVINVKDFEWGDYSKKKIQDLAELVRYLNLKFAFRQLYPNKNEYTWARQKNIGSRLDGFYLSPDLLKGLLEVSHHAYLSDHKYTTMLVMLPEVYRKSEQKECDKVSN